MKMIGLIKDDTLDEHQQKLVDSKRKEYEDKQSAANGSDGSDGSFPDGAQLCMKCQTKAAVLMDGCMTCLNCGESKCG